MFGRQVKYTAVLYSLMSSEAEPRARKLPTESYNQVLAAFFQAAQQQAAGTESPVPKSSLTTNRIARLERLADITLATALNTESTDVLFRDQIAAVEDR